MNMTLERDLLLVLNRAGETRYDSKHYTIISGLMGIKKGFKWNGANFAHDGKRIQGKPQTWKATCLHDVMIQDKNCPFSRKEIDLMFLDQMRKDSFPFAYIYYLAVRIFAIIRGKK